MRTLTTESNRKAMVDFVWREGVGVSVVRRRTKKAYHGRKRKEGERERERERQRKKKKL